MCDTNTQEEHRGNFKRVRKHHLHLAVGAAMCHIIYGSQVCIGKIASVKNTAMGGFGL